MKHTNPPKKLQDLNLMDRFLFSEVIESAEAYKIILEIILEREINFKGEPVAENEKRKELLGKIARLDVCAIGDDDRVYNAEVQKENQNNLHKRMRYYGALMTSKLLPEGTIDYNRLSDLCMIVIAGFDMGGEGKYRYTVRRMYEGYPDKEVYDGEVILYLNTKGKDTAGVSNELIAMLEYFEETTDDKALSSGYERIIRLNEIVSSIKASDEIGVKYMNAYEERMHDIQEAREQGEKTGEERGRTEGLEAGIAQGEASKALEMAKAMKVDNEPVEKIVKYTGLPKEKVELL
ncbi:MAG: Rpn family recombination-promoting nuclease/putative transposase [Eubacteriales bacterium]|nr:Rpn family recombination-promoting nuclease/putative transposase [Clostridiales bacterium]MDD7308516.1 Rpn family recombination-promoting nuclease/putative transposase [Eubacteriales bacterium]MDY2932633.1 Rpn family recombination-promoting nuclease/putative transposase [Anaerovoracaceae bacterium]